MERDFGSGEVFGQQKVPSPEHDMEIEREKLMQRLMDHTKVEREQDDLVFRTDVRKARKGWFYEDTVEEDFFSAYRVGVPANSLPEAFSPYQAVAEVSEKNTQLKVSIAGAADAPTEEVRRAASGIAGALAEGVVKQLKPNKRKKKKKNDKKHTKEAP